MTTEDFGTNPARDGLSDRTPAGHYRLLTASGSEYDIEALPSGRRRVRRHNANAALRRDDDWLFLAGIKARIGQPAVLILEPLGEGAVTTRLTTPVVAVVVDDD
ncbi:hypothetical protein [Lacticaseibacillus suihuaensis]